VATAGEHRVGMTSGELLDLVRSKRAEVNKYIEASSRRRRLLVNLVIVGSVLATTLTAPAAVGGKTFTNWLQEVFNSSSPSWQYLCLFATIGSVTTIIATQLQKSNNYEENVLRARGIRTALETLDISITSGQINIHDGTKEFLKCLDGCSFIEPIR